VSRRIVGIYPTIANCSDSARKDLPITSTTFVLVSEVPGTIPVDANFKSDAAAVRLLVSRQHHYSECPNCFNRVSVLAASGSNCIRNRNHSQRFSLVLHTTVSS